MRNRTTTIVIAAAVVVAAVFLAGYLPQRTARVAAEERAEALAVRVTAAEATVRMADLLGRALTLKDAAMRNDFGSAGEQSSPFFDAVRAEGTASPNERLRASLTSVLASRDAVTAALARADSASAAAIYQVELRLREGLGYPIPAPVAAAP